MTALNQIANGTNLIEVNTITPDVFDASVANELVNPFFGKMKSKEWSITIYKHLDHYLRQFGV